MFDLMFFSLFLNELFVDEICHMMTEMTVIVVKTMELLRKTKRLKNDEILKIFSKKRLSS